MTTTDLSYKPLIIIAKADVACFRRDGASLENLYKTYNI